MKFLRRVFGVTLALASPSVFAGNFLVNSGWEDGDLTAWTTNEPSSLQSAIPIVESTVVHSGKFAALMPEDFYLDQQFAPIATSAIQNVSYWIKQTQFQPNPTFFSANILEYSDGSSTYLVPRPPNDGGWHYMDLTADLARGKFLTGIRVYGATTLGAASPKTYFDDFNVGTVPAPEPATMVILGPFAIAIALRRRR